MTEEYPKPHQLTLVLHAATHFMSGGGARIGIVQRAKCATTGQNRGGIIPLQELQYSITQENIDDGNVDKARKAEMLALWHALNCAFRTIMRRSRGAVHVQRVTVLLQSKKIIETINHHILHGPGSLEDMQSPNDRAMIKKIAAAAQGLLKRGYEVSVLVSNGDIETERQVAILAREEGPRARRRRPPPSRVGRHATAKRVQDRVGEDGALGGTFNLPFRMKGSSDTMDDKHLAA